MLGVSEMVKRLLTKAELHDMLRVADEKDLRTVLDKIASLRERIKKFLALEKISAEQRKLATERLANLEKNIQSVNQILFFAWQNDTEALDSLVNNLKTAKEQFEIVHLKQPPDWFALCEMENDFNLICKMLSYYMRLNPLPDDHPLQQIKKNYNQHLKRIQKEILAAAAKAMPDRMLRMPNLICSFTANINRKNVDGRTLLHEAALEEDEEMVILLVVNGADTGIREAIDNYPAGYHPTPLDIAIEKNSVKIVLYLLSVSAHKQFHDGMSQCDLNKEFRDACYKNQVNDSQSVMQQCRDKNIQLDPNTIFIGIVLAARQGFEKVVTECLKLKVLNDFEKNIIIEICLEHGYPQLLNLLQWNGFPLAKHQQAMASALLFTRSSGLGGDAYIDRRDHTHDDSSGGSSNESLYQKEFRDMVAYIKYYVTQNRGSFFQLIENLGVRRLRQAQLARLSFNFIEYYGRPTDREMHTYYQSSFADYAKKINASYDKKRLKSRNGVQVEINLNGRPVLLTQINDLLWTHPDGTHRTEILVHVDKLCQKIHTTHYDDPKIFAKDLAEVYWILSHAPPMLRGIRTVIEALADAFWEMKFPLLRREKKFDLNCEALVFDRCEDYQKFFVEHMGVVPNANPKLAIDDDPEPDSDDDCGADVKDDKRPALVAAGLFQPDVWGRVGEAVAAAARGLPFKAR